MTGFFSELQSELVSRSAQMSGASPPRWRLQLPRERVAAGVIVVLAAGGGAVGLATGAEGPAPVTAVSAEVRAAVPALSSAPVRVPALVKRAFDNAPDPTVNGALARPLVAGLPDGSISWVAPTANGACLGVPDTVVGAVGVVCASTKDIEKRGLVIGTYGGDPELGSGTEIGIGGRSDRAEADGSYRRQIR